MKRFRIKEWCPIRFGYVVWVGEFACEADAYSAIEYFGSVEELEDVPLIKVVPN